MHQRVGKVFALLFVLMPLAANAELIRNEDEAFTVRHQVVLQAEPFTIYRTLTAHINEWWSGDHSWSGDAANLYTKMERNGCFCEKLPGGGVVEHLRLVYFKPGVEVRWHGGIGPLQTMPVNGIMVWKIDSVEGGQQVTFEYQVWGQVEGGLGGIAAAVDGVIGEQLTALARRSGQN